MKRLLIAASLALAVAPALATVQQLNAVQYTASPTSSTPAATLIPMNMDCVSTSTNCNPIVELGLGTSVFGSNGSGNGLTVSVSNWPPGGPLGYDFQLSPTVTVQKAAYSAGYSLGGLITATKAARTNGGSGILTGLSLRSAGGATNTIWVYAWSKTPASTCTDNVAFGANSADAPYALVGFPQSITLASPGSWDTASMASITSQVANFQNKDTSPGTALYFCLVTAGSVTPATTADLSIVLGGIQD